MNRIKIAMFLLMINFTMFSQSIKREDKISGIKEVLINGSLVLNISHSNKESLTFEGKESLLKDIKVIIKGSYLEIKMPKKAYFDLNDKIIVNLTLKDFKELEFEGAGDIFISGFSLKDFKLKMNGSSDALLKDNIFEQLQIDINGSGSVQVNGKCDNLVASLDGVGKLSAYELDSTNVKVNLNGAGKVEINVKESLAAKLNGVGKIIYKGNPELDKIELNGLGTIKKYQEEEKK